MQVKCAGCGETFALRPETAEMIESKNLDDDKAIRKVMPKPKAKTHTAKCPKCGTYNTVRG